MWTYLKLVGWTTLVIMVISTFGAWSLLAIPFIVLWFIKNLYKSYE